MLPHRGSDDQGLLLTKGEAGGSRHSGGRTRTNASTCIKRATRGAEHTLSCRSLEAVTYQRILVPIDGSATSDRGLDEAIRLAKLTGGRLRLVHVVDGLVLSTGLEFATCDVVGLLVEAGAEILSAATAKVESAGVAVDTFLSHTLAERVCDVVVAQARQWKAELK